MRMNVCLCRIHSSSSQWLTDGGAVLAALHAAAKAGAFTVMDARVHAFETGGLTAFLVVGESHLAVHTWPEEQQLFLDIASCGDPKLVEVALAAFVAHVPGAQVLHQEVRNVGDKPQ
jgi:S-adenosylmethionine decarboxylase